MSPKQATKGLNILLPLFFLSPSLVFSARIETTNFSFPQFSANDSTVKVFGDAQFNADNHSWIMNAKSAATLAGTCASLTYNGTSNLQIQDSATGTLASFSTSFTFKFTTPLEQQIWDDFNSTDMSRVSTSMSFLVAKSTRLPQSMQDMEYWDTQPGACIYLPSNGWFAVFFGTVYNYKRNVPSNNFIGIFDGLGDPIFKAGYTHNLCGNQTHCSYLSNGGSFTTWIDLTPEGSLQVRLINGSYPQIQKPLTPLLELLNYQLPTAMGDYVSLTFIASSAENHIQAHELSSWNFYSSGIQEMISSPKRKWIGPVLWVSGILAFLLIVGCLSLWFAKHQCYVASRYSSIPGVFSYKELRNATKNFSTSEKLGSGGFGTVYKGSFKSSGTTTLVAVKRINYESKHAKTTFLAEISSLSQIRHGNIVQLQGWCHEKDRLLLVYTYMPNGSLNEWLHVSNNSSGIGSGSNGERRAPLPWKLRHRILQGVAAAVEYLHKDCPQCVLHRDIKSSNVMLDADFKAHLGDFGLARLMDHQRMEKTTMAAGTIGYMAPEVSYNGKATKESDVYSFGILVLEVVCGRQPLDMNAHELDVKTLNFEDHVLLNNVWRAHETRTYLNVADPRLLQPCSHSSSMAEPHDDEPATCAIMTQLSSSIPFINGNVDNNKPHNEAVEITNIEVSEEMMVENLLRLGLFCCLPNPKARPIMEQVSQILKQIGNFDNVDYAITKVSMPPLPTTNPVERHYSLHKILAKNRLHFS